MNEKHVNLNIDDKNLYLNILKNDPNNYEAILKLGLIDVNKNNFSFAKEKFKKLLEINIARYEAHLNLSNIYSLEGDIIKAKNILKEFLINIQENIEIINALAIKLSNLNENDDLEIHINKYIDKYESHILYYLKGYILSKSDKISESEVFFKKSINLNVNFWNAYQLLLKQYEKQSRLKDFKTIITSAKKYSKII